MEAIREIREIDSDKLSIDIPARFRKRKVEIIVLPIDEISTGQPGILPVSVLLALSCGFQVVFWK